MPNNPAMIIVSTIDIAIINERILSWNHICTIKALIAAKIYKKLVSIKKIIKNKKNISSFLNLKKKELKNNYKIKIDYLELRNINNLKISSTKQNSRLFIAYYLNNIRLIDNL